jgi:uncharacterized protein (TIGR03067 family)
MTRFPFAIALVAAAAILSAGRADDPPKKAEPVRLTTEKLGEMLTDMGYEPTFQDKLYYKVKVSIPDWNSVVWLWITSGGKEVRLFAEFTLRAGFEDAPAGAWVQLLEKNDNIGPAAFGLDPKGKRLTLYKPLPNADLTPAKLRKELAGFAELIKKNKDVWQATNFIPVMTPEARKVLDRFAGTWKVTSFVDRGKAAGSAETARLSVAIEKSTIRAVNDGKDETLKATIYLDVRDGKSVIDLHGANSVDYGIFKLEGDTLSICAAAGGAERPAAIAGTEKTVLLVLKRDKK